MAVTRLFILRHGNTFDKGDVITRVGGRTDLPLSTSGTAQAAALADHFEALHFDAAFCSPLLRTLATARAILSRHVGAPALLIAPFLKEVDYGPDENRPEPEVIARIGEDALTAWDTDARVPVGWHVDIEGIQTGWRELLQRARTSKAQNALIVTSNGIARFLPDLVDERPDNLGRKLKTAAWGIVDVTDTGSRIMEWGSRL